MMITAAQPRPREWGKAAADDTATAVETFADVADIADVADVVASRQRPWLSVSPDADQPSVD